MSTSEYSQNREVLEDLKYAIQHLNYEKMVDVLKNIDDINEILIGESQSIKDPENQIFAGTNPLIFLIRHGDKRSINFLKCVELLIEKKINLEFKGEDTRTALSWARELKMTDTINLITSKLKELPVERELSTEDRLEKYFEEGRKTYILNIDHTEIVKGYTLLQLCCRLDLTISAAYLLENGADPNKTTDDQKNTPIMIAAIFGHDKIIELLLEKGVEVNLEVLCAILKYIDRKDHNFESSYKKVMDNLKKTKKPNELYTFLNEKDKQLNPPLHYALRYADSATVEELLMHGASLGSTNKLGNMLIKYIKPSILENHLNNCVQDKTNGGELQYEIDYRSLVPPIKIPTEQNREDDDGGSEDNGDEESGTLVSSLYKRIRNETDIIYYMSNSSRLKHFMKHPVIATFLLRKWNLWNHIFLINFCLFIFFLLSVIVFVSDYPCKVRQILLFISLLLLVFRELFELNVTKLDYFKRYDNYIELLLIINLGFMLVLDFTHNSHTQLSSIAFLLAAFEFMLVLGVAPICSTNMTIFSTVLYNYMKFLIWYSVLLLGFTFSFYYLLKCKNMPFINIYESFYKIIIMMTGELDAGNINFDMYPLIGKLIFALFIFMIPIVLLNLLNGLAVNDIQIIKHNAEIIGYATLANNIKIVEGLIYKYKPNLIKDKSIFMKNKVCKLTVKENTDSTENQSILSYLQFWKKPIGIDIGEIKELVQTEKEKQVLDIKTLTEMLSVIKQNN